MDRNVVSSLSHADYPSRNMLCNFPPVFAHLKDITHRQNDAI